MAKHNSPPTASPLDHQATQLKELMTGIEPMVLRMVDAQHDPDKATMIKNLRELFKRLKEVPTDGSLFSVLGLTDDCPDED